MLQSRENDTHAAKSLSLAIGAICSKPLVELSRLTKGFDGRLLRHELFQRVLVVQTSENRLRSHAAIIRNLVAARGRLWNWRERYWNTRPKTLVWTAVIVMRDPLKKRAFQVVLGKRDDEVQALTPCRAHNPLAISIPLRGAHRRP